MDPRDPVSVFTTFDLYEAELIKQHLQGEGILCVLAGTNQGAYVGEMFEIKVLVPDSEAEKARGLIESYKGGGLRDEQQGNEIGNEWETEGDEGAETP
jgi:hypothetical protein